ncbi:MAG: hypothetical protein ACI9XK_001359 [Granulosicoccus sp.]|jgi:hypothetical protein
MKLFLAISVAAAIASGCAKPAPFTGADPARVVKVNADASAIYHGSLQWIAENFQSAKEAIQYQDEGTKTVIGRGQLSKGLCRTLLSKYVPKKTAGIGECRDDIPLEFVMKVEAKDSRLRVSIPNMTYRTTGGTLSRAKDVQASREIVSVMQGDILSFGDDIAAYIIAGGSKSAW